MGRQPLTIEITVEEAQELLRFFEHNTKYYTDVIDKFAERLGYELEEIEPLEFEDDY